MHCRSRTARRPRLAVCAGDGAETDAAVPPCRCGSSADRRRQAERNTDDPAEKHRHRSGSTRERDRCDDRCDRGPIRVRRGHCTAVRPRMGRSSSLLRTGMDKTRCIVSDDRTAGRPRRSGAARHRGPAESWSDGARRARTGSLARRRRRRARSRLTSDGGRTRGQAGARRTPPGHGRPDERASSHSGRVSEVEGFARTHIARHGDVSLGAAVRREHRPQPSRRYRKEHRSRPRPLALRPPPRLRDSPQRRQLGLEARQLGLDLVLVDLRDPTTLGRRLGRQVGVRVVGDAPLARR